MLQEEAVDERPRGPEESVLSFDFQGHGISLLR